jgi:hypothetical protein
MITHLVFFNMLPEANGATGEENAEKLVAMLQALPQQIPEIVELEAGLDFSGTPASYEVGLLTKFASKEDLETYRIHPQHQKVVVFVQQTTSERAVVDYES